MFYDIDNYDIASYADDNTPYTSDFNLIQKQPHESQRWQLSLTTY